MNVADKDVVISKFNKIIKNIQINVLTSTSTKINFLNFILDFMSLTRGNELLNNLKSIKYLGKFKRLKVKSIARRPRYGTIYSGFL